MAENTIIHEISLAGYKATSTGGMLDLGTWGSYGIEKLHLTLDAAWQDLTITAFFNVNGKVVAKRVVGKDGYADVPWEATKENTFAGCLAFEGSINGQRRISTNLNYKVTNHSETTDSDPVPTDDRWNQFVTETKGYRDGAFEAAEKANARAEDAETASEDAQAAARAAKASENAAAASASNAAADAAKAGPYAEAARAAQEAAESARDEAIAAQQAAENAAAAAAASKSAADTLAAEAARAAQAAENSKAAANNAADLAGENATAAQQAADTATAAANDAGQSASDAAASKAAAETAAKAAQDAQTAAAAAKAEAVKAQEAAQTAAKSAQDAQAAAEKARDEVKAAQKGAEAARDTAAKSAEAAAKSEANAKQSADTLAESVENVVANTAAVAELKKKKAEIDDAAVGANAWSSKHIIDMLCPPLEESGNPVVCYPVAGYALGVKAKWEPTQEGSGEPSPENIRPIKGRDSVTVNRADGLRAWGMLTLDGTEHWIASDNVVEGMRSYFVPNAVAVTNTPIATRSTEVCTHYRIIEYNAGVESALLSAEPYAYIVTNRFDSVEELKAYLAAQHAAGTPVQIAYKLKKPAVVPDTNGIFFSEQPAQGGSGDPSPDNIRPILLNNTVQVGQTNTLTLPETVYGGEVDAVSGEGCDKYRLLTVDGTERWTHFDDSELPNAAGYIRYSTYLSTPSAEKYDSQSVVGISSVGKTGNTGPGTKANVADLRPKSGILIFNVKASEKVYPLENWKSYLAAKYAAGTPVQVCYKLAEPVPFTATGAQPMPALAGANTVLTDADSATVTGRADPIKRTTDLEDAVASQT